MENGTLMQYDSDAGEFRAVEPHHEGGANHLEEPPMQLQRLFAGKNT
jgi:hypothetical protein